ncbi:MAG: hypothetical protein QMD09_15235, partial [Desulfatibacillaceae bacterium]|nr:hypothetical protein [Desulfatibacillaceae bacterium]
SYQQEVIRAGLPDKQPKGTVWLQEIARADANSVNQDNKPDKTGKLALVVMHLGLANWLNGRMQRTLFVREHEGLAEEIARLNKVNGFGDKKDAYGTVTEKQDGRVVDQRAILKLTSKPVYSDILKDVEKIQEGKTDYSQASQFLYHRKKMDGKYEPGSFKRDAEQMLANGKKEYGEVTSSSDIEILASLLCTVTPTPSTILDTWMSGYGFIGRILNGDDGNGNKDDNNKNPLAVLGSRWIITIEGQRLDINKDDFYRPMIGEWKAIETEGSKASKAKSGSIGVVFTEDKKAILLDGNPPEKAPFKMELRFEDEPKSILIKADKATLSEQKEGCRPYRVLSAYPNLGLVLVPGSKALEVAQFLKDEYANAFGKVRGRLPFHVGVLFFKYKHPIYLALDAAQRMVEGFEARARNNIETATVIDSVVDSCCAEKRQVSLAFKGRRDRSISFGVDRTVIKNSNNVDRHRPYFVLDEAPEGGARHPSFFKTFAFPPDKGERDAHLLPV